MKFNPNFTKEENKTFWSAGKGTEYCCYCHTTEKKGKWIIHKKNCIMNRGNVTTSATGGR
ncbi:MAG: hypothetical protein WC307_05190 [Candidatus Nanoarchaeia archaeon]|jgi:DNA primase large subunit